MLARMTPDVETRAKQLLAQMTLEEKVAQLTSLWLHLEPGSGDFAPAQTAGLFGMDESDKWGLLETGLGQVTRPFGSRPIDPVAGTRALNRLQKQLVEGTRLGIPAIAHEEALTGFMTQGATQFPSPLNYGSTWDPDLIERVADVIRRQMRAVGTHQALAPVADVIRDARWGRVEECVSEDPYLVGCIVSAYVRGLQGDDLREGVVATLKHFAGYSGSEGGRNFAPLHAGPREMAEVFLLPFEMAVKTAGALSVMNGYHDIDGQPCASSYELLTEILRERWGFEGIVVADYGAVWMLESLHGAAADDAEAAAAALGAGLDVELPAARVYPKGIPEALAAGSLTAEIVDRAALRVLRLKLRLGLMERPYVDEGPIVLERDEDRALSREVADASLTLLRNDGVLPLDAERCGRVAVIGPNANDAMALFGNYSFLNHVTTHFDEPDAAAGIPTVLDALRERLGPGRVSFAQGCFILRADAPAEPGTALLSDDRSGFDAAVTAAREADVAVLVVGDRAGHFRTGTVGEGTDTDDLSLPGVQPELAEAVASTGTPTVVVLVNGRPFDLTGLDPAMAILEAWFPGQDGAAAIADVLFGVRNPSGRTPVSFSRGAGVQPAYYNHKRLARGVPGMPAFRPLFPFGHGLSYTRFEYADLSLSSRAVPVDGEVEISFQLRNTGQRSGAEVAQLYVHDPAASVTRPVRELKGFARVDLEAGERRRVSFRLHADMLSFIGPGLHRIVEPGTIEVFVGGSSEDTPLQAEFELTGEVRRTSENRVLLTPVVS